MNKTDAIARRIFGWALNRWDRWYDSEKGIFIPDSDFQPERNIDHAMMIVEKLEQLGFSFKKIGESEVFFNDVCAKGETLAQAITNAAYTIVENHSTSVSSNRIWRQLC